MDSNLKRLDLNRTSSGHSKSKSKLKGFFTWIVIFLLLIFAGYWFLNSTSTTSSIFNLVAPSNPIKSTDDRVNILLLGNAGGKHDGAMLTDSIIIASYNLKTHKAVLISVPRDLWLQNIKNKVNAAYELGEARDEGGGLKFAEDKIDDILGMPIHYGVRIDFNGFAKAIDQVDGIDIEVERSFDDYKYPLTGKENELCGYKEEERDISEDQAKQLNIEKGKRKFFIDPQGQIATDTAKIEFECRYEHIHFDKGTTHMDGTTALKFVRSRHGLNGEGSDFARSKRQQLVLQAFRSKVLSLQTLANPQKVFGLIDTFGQSFETDIPKNLFLNFYNLVKSNENTKSLVLGNLDDGTTVFITPSLTDYGGAWVLIPPKNDFIPIQEYLKRTLLDFDLGITPTPKPTNTPKATKK